MKSKFLKKRLSVMLVGTAVFSLAACSGGADTGEPAETLTEESVEVQAEAEDTDAGQEPAAGEETDAAADFPVPLIPSQRWSRRQRSQKGFPLETERQRTVQMLWKNGLPISV
ncbi:hypothetical protein [Lachnoclostridium sp. An76]|uniref:hypothetical protein n=1 Tax=Lachnoclostridium sp. An76 TaxID=1965654 RepID=UPI000B3AD22A|nr:hypothetical protein [Lachnoclostridium sp. An76]OUN32921.1 hypothetical protein B5G27_13820 [Lachnoclostridium sp. An76]